jgi:putative transposase
MISILPKYAVSQVVGYIKGKSAIPIARVYGERKRKDRRLDQLSL